MFTATWFKDTAERALKSFVQAFVSVLIVSGAYDLDALKAATIAGITAGLTVVKSVIAALIPSDISPASVASGSRRYIVDGVERLIFTFIEVFLATWLIDPHFNLSSLQDAAIAGLAAGLSALTSLLSGSVAAISPASLVKPAAPATTHTV